jgi:hypothetical protein
VTRTQRTVPVQALCCRQVMDMSLYFFLAVVHHRAFFVKWDHPVGLCRSKQTLEPNRTEQHERTNEVQCRFLVELLSVRKGRPAGYE